MVARIGRGITKFFLSNPVAERTQPLQTQVLHLSAFDCHTRYLMFLFAVSITNPVYWPMPDNRPITIISLIISISSILSHFLGLNPDENRGQRARQSC